MAKQPPKDDGNKKIEKLLEGLYKIVQVTNSSSKEQIKINRELLKVMSLLQAGFAQNEKDARALIDDVREGLEINDEYAKKWAKQRGATKDDLDEIVKKFRDIEKVDIEIIDNAEDYIQLLEQRYDILSDEVDISSKLLKSHQEIAKAVRDSKTAAKSMGLSIEEVDSVVDKLVRKKVDLSTMFEGMVDSGVDVSNTIEDIKNDIDKLISNASGNILDMNVRFSPLTDDLDSEVNDIMKSIQSERNARIDGLTDYFDKNTKLQNALSRKMAADFAGLSDISIDIDTGDISKSGAKLLKGTDEYQEVIKQLDSIVDTNKIGEQLKVRFQEINELLNTQLVRTDEQSDKLKSLLEPLDLASKMMLEQMDTANKTLQIQEANLQIERARYKIIANNLDQMATFESIVVKIGSGFDYINSVLPSGVGEFLGLSKVSLVLLESHKKGAKAFADTLVETGNKSKAISSYLETFGPAIRMALNPMTLLVAGGLLMYNYVSGITEKLKDMSANMKTSLFQSKQLLEIQLDTLTSQKNQFATMQDLQDVQSEMIGSSGKLYDLNTQASKELSISLVEIGKAFGYGSTQAVKLHKVFRNIGADDKLAESLQGNLGLMSEMAGISPQIVGEDLVDSAEIVSTYFAGLPEKAARTVLQVRRMGMSLKQAGEIAQKMLDLEGFMTDMYELQAMSAGGIDFSSAFDKGLMGDIEGMTKDIMNEIGTTAEYNRMDYMTRMKIAKTLGMSVDDLAKSVRSHEQLADFSGTERDNIESNLDRLGDISKLNKDQIRDRLQQLQSTDRLSVAWDKIKGTLVKALLPAVELFANLIDGLSPFIDIILFGFKAVGNVISGLLPLFKVITIPIKLLGDLLSGVTSKIDEIGNGANSLGTVFSSVIKIASGLGTIFVAKKMIGQFGSIGSGFGDMIGGMVKNIPVVGKIFGNVLSSATKTSGEVGKESIAAINSASVPINSMVEKVKGSITEMVEHVKESMVSIVQSIKSSTIAAQGDISKGISNTSTTSSTLLDKVKDKSIEVTSTISDESIKASKKSKDSIKSVGIEADKTVKGLSDKGKSVKFFNSDTSKTVFKMIGEIGSKTFAAMAIHSAMSFMSVKKEGESAISDLSTSAMPIFETLAMGGGSILTQYLTEGIQKVFTKKLEKTLEDGFDKPLTTVRKSLTKLPDSAKTGFDKVGSIAKGVLSKFGVGGGLLSKIFGKEPEIDTKTIETVGDTLVDSTKKTKSLLPEINETFNRTENSVLDKKEEVLNKSTELIGEQPLISKEQKPTEMVEKVKKTVKENVEVELPNAKKVKPIEVPGIDDKKVGSLKEKVSNLKSTFSSMFDSMVEIVKKGWTTIKDTLLDIVKFAGDVLKSISSSVGESVKKLLTSIGEGLSSFKTTALKGAASLLIVSGALWVTSKALQNFATVSWSDVGKGIVTLTGLVGAAMLLGGISAPILIGSVALGVLGASLIPVAYAMKQFNDIDWSSLAKAGVAIAGFGLIASGLSVAAPLILAGSAVLGVASVSLMLFSSSLSSLTDSVNKLTFEPISNLTKTLKDLTSIPVMSILGLSGAITTLGLSLMSFSAMNLGSSVSNGISSLLGGGAIQDIEKLSTLAEPLSVVNDAIYGLSDGLMTLSETMNSIDLGKISELKDIRPDFNIGDVISKKVEPVLKNNDEPSTNEDVNYPISPVKRNNVIPNGPSKRSVAQDKKISDNFITQVENITNQSNNGNVGQSDIYNKSDRTNQEMIFLLKQQNQLLEALLRKDLVVNMDGQKVNTINKKFNNNNG